MFFNTKFTRQFPQESLYSDYLRHALDEFPYVAIQLYAMACCQRGTLGFVATDLAARSAMVQEAPLKIYARGVASYFYFSRAPRARARAENKANQQCHFKSSRWRMDPLGTDSCRGTVPMEPPMSNGSMRHQNPDLDFDDTRMILQGASCTIAACAYIKQLRC